MSEVTWEALAQSLATTLARLPNDAVVVVVRSTDPSRYVQFMQSSESLYAEVASSPDAPNNISISPSVQAELRSSGWREPDPEQSLMNWYRDLPWPAPWQDYRQLAVTTTNFLRDTLGVASPESLVYRSWSRYTNEPLELPSLGIPAAAEAS